MKLDTKTIIDIEQDPGLHRKPNIFKPKKLQINIPKFHWTKDKPDSRDYKYIPTLAKTDSIVDLRQYCSPIEDQGNLGSCTGQAIRSERAHV